MRLSKNNLIELICIYMYMIPVCIILVNSYYVLYSTKLLAIHLVHLFTCSMQYEDNIVVSCDLFCWPYSCPWIFLLLIYIMPCWE